MKKLIILVYLLAFLTVLEGCASYNIKSNITSTLWKMWHDDIKEFDMSDDNYLKGKLYQILDSLPINNISDTIYLEIIVSGTKGYEMIARNNKNTLFSNFGDILIQNYIKNNCIPDYIINWDTVTIRRKSLSHGKEFRNELSKTLNARICIYKKHFRIDTISYKYLFNQHRNIE